MSNIYLYTKLEVCTGPGLARGSYPARQMRDDFSNGPGRQMRDDFFNGPANKWLFFQLTGPSRQKEKCNGRAWLQKKEDE